MKIYDLGGNGKRHPPDIHRQQTNAEDAQHGVKPLAIAAEDPEQRRKNGHQEDDGMTDGSGGNVQPDQMIRRAAHAAAGAGNAGQQPDGAPKTPVKKDKRQHSRYADCRFYIIAHFSPHSAAIRHKTQFFVLFYDIAKKTACQGFSPFFERRLFCFPKKSASRRFREDAPQAPTTDPMKKGSEKRPAGHAGRDGAPTPLPVREFV